MEFFNRRHLLSPLLLVLVYFTYLAYARSHHIRHHRDRFKRQQGAHLYLPGSYVTSDGEDEPDAGPWLEWSSPSQCSRTCGGGASTQYRQCMPGHRCRGPTRRHFSCNTQDCPDLADFRVIQCAEFNQIPFEGTLYEWVPYTKSPQQCELNCMPKGERFYYRHRLQVIDGTTCNDESLDVCVEGKCQPVGCDMMLGSDAREDNCRVCEGDGSTCNTMNGLLDMQDLQVGYNDVLLIPAGAVNIKVREIDRSNNYLAIRNASGHYYLNGNWRIDFPRTLDFAGSKFHYERSPQGFSAPDSITSLGPIEESIFIVLLYQDTNVGIRYEYSLPKTIHHPNDTETYAWTFDQFTPCSVSCGGGYQSRNVSCAGRKSLDPVESNLCDANNKPVETQRCGEIPCEPKWVAKEWEKCSEPCGDGGTQSRKIYCEQVISSGVPSIVDDGQCAHLQKPPSQQSCNEGVVCGEWHVGPWKPCNRLCGKGKETRKITCYRKVDGKISVLDDSECTRDEKPESSRSCLLRPCEGVDWVTSEWSGCENKCGLSEETRSVQCMTASGDVFPDSLCAEDEDRPEITRKCETKASACDYEWYASQWSECSAKCGTGIQTRKVSCTKVTGDCFKQVEESNCDPSKKYDSSRNCTAEETECPGEWFTGPWTKCSKNCGGGIKSRKVLCIRGNATIHVKECDPDLIPSGSEECNKQACDKDEVIPVVTGETIEVTEPTVEFDDEYEIVEDDKCEDGEWVDADSLPQRKLGPREKIQSLASKTLGESSDSDTKLVGDSPLLQDELMQSDDPLIGDDDSAKAAEDTGSGFEFGTTSPDWLSSFGTTFEGSGGLFLTGEGSGEDTERTDLTEVTETLFTQSSAYTVDSSVSTDSSSTETSESTEEEVESSSESTSEETDTTSTEEDVTGLTTEDTLLTHRDEDVSEIDVTGITTEEAVSEETEQTVSESEVTGLTTEEVISKATSEIVSELDVTGVTTDEAISKETEVEMVSELDATEDTTTDSASSQTDTEITLVSEISESTSESVSVVTDAVTDVSEKISTDITEESVTGTTQEVATDVSQEPTTEPSTDVTEDTSELTAAEVKLDTVSLSMETTTSAEATTIEEEVSALTQQPTETHPPIDHEVDALPEEETEIIPTSKSISTTSSFTEGEITELSTTELELTSTESTTKVDISKGTEDETVETSTTVTVSDITTESSETITSPSVSGVTEDTTVEVTTSIPFETTVLTTVVLTTFTDENVTAATGEEESTTTGFTPEVNITESTTEEVVTITDITEEPVEVTTLETITETTTEYDIWSSTETVISSTETSSIIEIFTAKTKWCKKPRKPTCKRSEFGCCPDKVTPAKGPFDKGCPILETCAETKYGCCEDGVSPAAGDNYKGCPESLCDQTLFGCCPDNKTPSQGNDNEGCPPPPPKCITSVFGCCDDNITEAAGPNGEGCEEEKAERITEEETEATFTPTVTDTTTTEIEDCGETTYGCCPDGSSAAQGEFFKGCTDIIDEKDCSNSFYKCCPDGVSSAVGPNYQGCITECSKSSFGCCEDGITPAHGYTKEGCCLSSKYGCCPDNIKPAEGPNQEGCGCSHSAYGCCPDNVTHAQGHNKEGCGCQYTEHGCCPDNHTPASGADYVGCLCHTFQFGCCPDGVTIAKGSRNLGCGCKYSEFDCCSDGKTAARGPNYEGCDCASSKYGCCPDGETEAQGEDFDGCTDIPENLQANCQLAKDRGTCRNYTVKWFYDMEYGGCSRFWYGGCDGNGNRFKTKEECNNICVEPTGRDRCNLPKVVGPCEGYYPQWYYDKTNNHCTQFVYGGCLGNNNRFETRAECNELCVTDRISDACEQPKQGGPCHGNYINWFYNRETGYCERFVYGGCKGNDNNFPTQAACKQKCAKAGEKKPSCALPQAQGNCTESLARWYYDSTEKRCMPFYYTGCGGNKNNFINQYYCELDCPKEIVRETCQLPADSGECSDYVTKYYYDTRDKACRQFYYGGCGGNGNNFISESECEARCVAGLVQPETPPPPEITSTTAAPEPFKTESCYLPPEVGPCRAHIVRWHYSNDGTCRQFIYGGCGGNKNNFGSSEECYQMCGKVEDICTLPMTVAQCDAETESWFYNQTADTCEKFTYGGCLGNANKFDDLESCEKRCKKISPTTSAPPITEAPTEDFCQLEADSGPCRARIHRWYHSSDGTCKEFIYGGCGGNRNNFASAEECSRYCGDTTKSCYLPPEAGPCRARIPRWYYSNDGTCRQFIYGGCGGNKNNFGSSEECYQMCGKVQDICTLPMIVVPCDAETESWFYNQTADTCEKFNYGGCLGNANNFNDLEACDKRCKKISPTTAAPSTTEAPTEDFCQLEADSGPCLALIHRWYHSSDGTCKEFIYGGCGGNRNNFASAEECSRYCGDTTNICQLPAEPGQCLAYMPRWYYSSDGTCKQFIFGGCGGNSNNFATAEECNQACAVTTVPAVPTTPRPGDTTRICYQSASVGNCNDTINLYYFDPYQQKCTEFTYSGCGGNDNRFNNMEACDRACGRYRDQNVCTLPSDSGHCRAYNTRFYYDKYTKECKEFMYGGCEGNGNRFHAIEECKEACLSEKQPEVPSVPSTIGPTAAEVCLLIADTGTCGEGNQKRFYYDNSKGDCIAFIYSGCGGNANNFKDHTDCYETCKPLIDSTYEPVAPPEPPTYEPEPEQPKMCKQYEDECRNLRCQYGMKGYVENLCNRCKCVDPCEELTCPEDMRCAVELNLYSTEPSELSHFIGICREINKTGNCPQVQGSGEDCREDCNDDADCVVDLKCCSNGCGHVCLMSMVTTLAPPGELRTSTETYLPGYTQGVTARNTYPPEVIEDEFNPVVTAGEGDYATLRCAVRGYPKPVFTWSRDNILIDGREPRYRILLEGAALQIISLYKTDAGIYLCSADNNIGTPLKKEIRLDVIDPVEHPTKVIDDPELSSVVVSLGSPATLYCYAYGYPEPGVMWWKDKEFVPFKSQEYTIKKEHTLIINSVKLHNLGVYTCHAYNGIGRPFKWSVTVHALGPVYSTNVEDRKYMKYVIDRPTETPSITPRPQYPYRPTRPTPQPWPTPAPIDIVTPPAVATTTPVPTTIVLPTPHRIFTVPVRVNITLATTKFPVGSDISIPCDVEGYPIPTVQWYKDGNPLQSSPNIQITESHRLIMRNVTESDSGEYRCAAGNEYSNATSTVPILIQGIFIHPSCKDSPFFANCQLIVRANFCSHKYYARFCCRSCTEVGMLPSVGPHLRLDTVQNDIA